MSKWPEIQLRRLTTCLDGRRVPLNSTERAEVPGDYPYWGANGIVDTVGDYLFDEELVLLGEDGAPFGDRLKDVAFLVQGRIWVNNHIHVLRPTRAVIARFLAYALNTVDWPRYISGSTREKLTQDDMARAQVPYPTLGHQRLIVHFLDDETARIDALITKKRNLVALIDDRVAVLRQHEVLRELDPTCGVGALPSGWGRPRLGTIVRLQRGHDLPDQIRVQGEIPVVSSGGVTGWHDKAAAHAPGVVTGRYGTIGSVYWMDTDYWPLNTTLYVRGFGESDPRWVYHLLLALPLDIDSAKSAVTGINRNIVGQLHVPQPPVETQQRIARTVDQAMDLAGRATRLFERQLGLLQEHRQALIKAAVTGEIDIPGVSAA